jgi:hypothetical protein
MIPTWLFRFEPQGAQKAKIQALKAIRAPQLGRCLHIENAVLHPGIVFQRGAPSA